MHYDATFKGDSLLSLLILNTQIMGLNTVSKHQKIVSSKYVYNKDGKCIGYKRIWNIPKTIISDVNFQLHFGFTYPTNNYEGTKLNQSYAFKGNLAKKHY